MKRYIHSSKDDSAVPWKVSAKAPSKFRSPRPLSEASFDHCKYR